MRSEAPTQLEVRIFTLVATVETKDHGCYVEGGRLGVLGE